MVIRLYNYMNVRGVRSRREHKQIRLTYIHILVEDVNEDTSCNYKGRDRKETARWSVCFVRERRVEREQSLNNGEEKVEAGLERKKDIREGETNYSCEYTLE